LRRLPKVAYAMVAVALGSCARRPLEDDSARMASLKETYDRLHEHFEKATAKEPLVASAFAARGQLVLAIRSGLIEELAGNVARRYLDRVTLDLTGLEAKGSGELKRKTILGRIKLGDWSVIAEVGGLAGHLNAGTPRVGLRGPNLIDVEIPVNVQESEGAATLHFAWDSAALANVVCKDFELTREIRGRVLSQSHLLSGAFRLDNTGERLTVTPLFPDRKLDLRLDLTSRSWAVVEAALRSQDTVGKCGMMMHPGQGVEQLKALAAMGIKVSLPDSIFRAVSLPARLHKTVKVNERTVELRLKAESLRIETASLWSSVSVQVQTGTKP
jgi:hypothetical protein